MSIRKKVAVVGATGIAGQQFLTALANHPWFEVVRFAGSPRSAGKRYEDALRAPNGQIGWWQPEPIPQQFRNMMIESAPELNLDGIDIVFTAIDSDAAKELEPLYAARVPVVSTASAFRMEEDVPLLIPGVNTAHAAMIRAQQKKRGWKGFVVPIPNCTTYGMACTLAPLQKAFGLKTVIMTSMQATSGAGRNGGVLALDMLDNLVPYIPKEEEKVQIETQKILGALQGEKFVPASFAVSCTCTRVPVTDGHTETVFIATERPATVEAAIAAFKEYKTDFGDLPSAPKNFFTVHDDPFHPQPRIDRDQDGGMSTHVGRIREEKALGGLKYVLLSHNTKAGAAKGALLVAENLCVTGYI
ncbi:aspartate-semialdehyde dehydrogenase [Oligoflexus tunisiensis]|uniref:aspartate-semialdehyde dehydrogenase n=1 Tax=Oligoflexus tunisiensis TaxID=708132 RepID=UPI000A6CC7ED|nr:aspartate-semialdehyde dehydrogenase [Oligoflexus tunisiensis]